MESYLNMKQKKTKFFIAIIPAKKKSSRFRNKNFKVFFDNYSLLELSIRNAIKVKKINEIYVSSDSRIAKNLAKEYKVNFIERPKKYCSTKATANDVIHHSIKIIKQKKQKYENIILIYLQPTSPLRNSRHINSAINLFKKKKTNVISVNKEKKSILKSILINKGKIKSIFKEKDVSSNFQKLQKNYYPNGSIYIFSINDFLRRKTVPIDGSVPYFMSKMDSIDIDDSYDFNMAQIIKKNKLNEKF